MVSSFRPNWPQSLKRWFRFPQMLLRSIRSDSSGWLRSKARTPPKHPANEISDTAAWTTSLGKNGIHALTHLNPRDSLRAMLRFLFRLRSLYLRVEKQRGLPSSCGGRPRVRRKAYPSLRHRRRRTSPHRSRSGHPRPCSCCRCRRRCRCCCRHFGKGRQGKGVDGMGVEKGEGGG